MCTLFSRINQWRCTGLIFAGTSQGFLRSTDTGVHWAESLQSLAKTQVHAVFVDFRTPTTVYVGTAVGVLKQNTGSLFAFTAKFERTLYEAGGQSWPDINNISSFRNGLNSALRSRLAQ